MLYVLVNIKLLKCCSSSGDQYNFLERPEYIYYHPNSFFAIFATLNISQKKTSRLPRVWPRWALIKTIPWIDQMFFNLMFISEKINWCFAWSGCSAENESSEVDETPFLANPPKSPFGPPRHNAEGECFAPFRTIYHQSSSSQRPGDNIYEYCALAQEICGFWDDFVGSYGSEGVFFGRRQVFILLPF